MGDDDRPRTVRDVVADLLCHVGRADRFVVLVVDAALDPPGEIVAYGPLGGHAAVEWVERFLADLPPELRAGVTARIVVCEEP